MYSSDRPRPTKAANLPTHNVVLLGPSFLEEKVKAALCNIASKRLELESAPVGHPSRRSASISLANALSEWYGRGEAMADLDEIISLRRIVLEVTPPQHREHLESLISLTNFLEQRYKRERILKDLAEIIPLRRAVLKLIPPGHPEHRSALVNLANHLSERCQRESSTDDLGEVIFYQRAALEVPSPGHPEYLVSLNHLVNSLEKRLTRRGDMKDLTEIIAYRRAVLALTPPWRSECRMSLVHLANCLGWRYQVEGAMEDLTEIINLHLAALDLTRPWHPERLPSLINLTNCLDERLKREDAILDTMEIITHRRAAWELAPPWHPQRLASLVKLAAFSDERVREEDAMKDLTEIITYRRAVLEVIPPDHPDHLAFVLGLARSLGERFRRGCAMEDLAELITLRRTVLGLAPSRHPERLAFLLKLGAYLEERFRKEGNMEDLTELIVLRRTALELTPSRDPERLAFLLKLAAYLEERFRKERSKEDLTELITLGRAALDLTPPEHPEYRVLLTGLARNLDERFRREGVMEDSTETITLQRAILEFTPLAERLAALVNLSNSLDERFRKGGGMEDLTEAITHRRVALRLTPPDYPERYMLLIGLARNLDEKFRREGAMEDLKEAITLRRTILEFAPSAERLTILVDLANNLDERFRKEGTMDHLAETIAYRRATLELDPSGYPERIAPLVSLANSLDREDSLAGLDKRVSLRRAILECTPAASPDRSMSLVNLATCLREKYQRLGFSAAELDEATAHARDAVALCPPAYRELSRECLASCIELKIKSRDPPVAATISDTKQIILNIVDEIVTTLPLRLLDTETGALCERDAQILRFERSAPCKELLASASKWDSLELEMQARRVISKFFGYAMLSHKWGRGEPLFCDMKDTRAYDLHSTDGVVKLQKFCLLAFRRDFLWAWSDTCCIDKGSSAELQEAIGSMFSWYRRSGLTIVYLSDVPDMASFTKSVWFKRGWTLQELLASETVSFYMRDWSPYANNASLNHKSDDAVLKGLQNATGIGESHLRNFRPGMDDARLRLTWASTRLTTKPEDIAYSLFGVLDLHLPVLYGETAEKALGRLLAEIISQSGDVSVLDWVGQRSTFHSCFPATLRPYQTVLCTQLIPSKSTGPSNVDTKRVSKLHKAIVKLPRLRFINRRLALPSFVYPVTTFTLLRTWGSPLRYEYEIHASGLTPLLVTLTSSLQAGSDSTYALVRPWHPKWFAPGAKDNKEAIQMLLERFGQPFHTLLLRALPHNEYERIGSDCTITACAKDVSSIVNSNLQVLEIV